MWVFFLCFRKSDLLPFHFSDAFVPSRKKRLLSSTLPSTRPHVVRTYVICMYQAGFHSTDFRKKFISETFIKICGTNPDLVKTGQKCRALYKETCSTQYFVLDNNAKGTQCWLSMQYSIVTQFWQRLVAYGCVFMATLSVFCTVEWPAAQQYTDHIVALNDNVYASAPQFKVIPTLPAL